MKLHVDNISKTYGDIQLFRDTSLLIEPGEIICIKTGVLDGGTTLLKMLAGLTEPDSGKITLNNKVFSEHEPTFLFKNVSMCFEEGGALDVFSNYNNIVLPILYHQDIDPDEIHHRIDRIGTMLNLLDHMDKEPFQLNDVQKRLLNLCRALVIEPSVIIIDELQSGMSKDIRDNVINFLLSEQREKHFSIILTTTAGDRTDFSDRVYRIENYNLIQESQ